MRKIFVCLLPALLPLVLAAQTQVIQFKQAGEFANFSTPPDSLSSVTLSVSRNSSTTGGNSASLTYVAFSVSPDFSSETVVEIFATINPGDFTGNTTRNLTLNFDTSELDPATSFSESCTVDLNLLTQVCGPVPQGSIHLTFNENGLQRTKVLNLDEVITAGSTTMHIHQKSDSATANMQGTIFGVAFSSTSASVGVNKDSSVEVSKN